MSDAAMVQIELRQAELLECVHGTEESFDALVSTYALHHLPEDEKAAFWSALPRVLDSGGVLAMGDLMFADEHSRRSYLARLREQGDEALADAIEEEFFWNIETATLELEALGLRVESERISELSWGLVARR